MDLHGITTVALNICYFCLLLYEECFLTVATLSFWSCRMKIEGSATTLKVNKWVWLVGSTTTNTVCKLFLLSVPVCSPLHFLKLVLYSLLSSLLEFYYWPIFNCSCSLVFVSVSIISEYHKNLSCYFKKCVSNLSLYTVKSNNMVQ